MSFPAPNVRATTSARATVALTNAASTAIFILSSARIGWAIRNPVSPNAIVYITLVDLGAAITDASAQYALQPGDILTDSDVKGYCGPIWGSSSANVTVVTTSLT